MNQSLNRELFKNWSSDKIRYSDTDRQGHVNNACFASFCETGRVNFLYNPKNPLSSIGFSFVIAKLIIEFHAELNWPGDVEIGTAVKSLGKSSMTLIQGLYQADKLVATAETVIVQVNDETKKSANLNEVAIKFLKTLS